ncbi:hypothetical protein EBS43_10290 [bacterium]|nr:hypothetical protein [bacterium]
MYGYHLIKANDSLRNHLTSCTITTVHTNESLTSTNNQLKTKKRRLQREFSLKPSFILAHYNL